MHVHFARVCFFYYLNSLFPSLFFRRSLTSLLLHTLTLTLTLSLPLSLCLFIHSVICSHFLNPSPFLPTAFPQVNAELSSSFTFFSNLIFPRSHPFPPHYYLFCPSQDSFPPMTSTTASQLPVKAPHLDLERPGNKRPYPGTPPSEKGTLQCSSSSSSAILRDQQNNTQKKIVTRALVSPHGIHC